MRIEEIGQKVETFVKSDKGKIAIIGGFGGLFLLSYMLQKNKLNNSDYEEGVPLSKIYTSYPTVDANSETVIDSVENEIRNNHIQTQDYINDALVKLQQNQTLNTVPNNTVDYDQTYNTSISPDVVGYQQAAINARNNLEKQLVTSGLDNLVTSNGKTLQQNVNLLGTTYNGSVINQVGTNGDGTTTIHTQNGKTYTVPQGQNINKSITNTSESTNISKASESKLSSVSSHHKMTNDISNKNSTTLKSVGMVGHTLKSIPVKKG